MLLHAHHNMWCSMLTCSLNTLVGAGWVQDEARGVVDGCRTSCGMLTCSRGPALDTHVVWRAHVRPALDTQDEATEPSERGAGGGRGWGAGSVGSGDSSRHGTGEAGPHDADDAEADSWGSGDMGRVFDQVGV